MKKVLIAGLLSTAVLECSSQQAYADDMEQLRILNATFIHNFVKNDTVSHNRIIHPDFVCITSTGRTIKRKEYLEGWLHGFDGYVYWDYRNEEIKIFGNTALVHAQNKYVVIKDGKEMEGMSMYTDTYIKEKGEWKCVLAQLCKVAPENFGADETIKRKYDYRKTK
ncbi:MAG: nuclear transport factor 2 family protein [Bacteroidota bacterium]